MVTLLRTLVWLPLALTAPTQLPHPDNLSVTITSANFVHFLKWAPGPGIPPGVHYKVTYTRDRGKVWNPVTGCERVQHPLVCELTKTFPDLYQAYYINVMALLEDQVLGSKNIRFCPISDTHLDPPLLTLTPCDRDLCVDLRPPVENLRDIYLSMRYSLRIRTNVVEQTKNVKPNVTRQVLPNLNPGREYCVSIRFSDDLVDRNSNYSGPVCAVAPGNGQAASDALIAVLVCLLLLFAMVMVAMLGAAGYICPSRRSLPRVLTSVRHVDITLVFPGSSLTSLLTVEATAPPAGTQQSPSEENGEELTESSGGSSGGLYMQWDKNKLLSSSSSSSTPAALHPSTQAVVIRSSSQAPPQPPGGLTAAAAAAAPPRSCEAPAECLSGGEAQEEEEEVEEEEEEEEEEEKGGGSQEVNLLTLTFGMQPEDKPASSSSEDVTSELPAPTWMFSPVEEGEEEEEEESGYMPH